MRAAVASGGRALVAFVAALVAAAAAPPTLHVVASYDNDVWQLLLASASRLPLALRLHATLDAAVAAAAPGDSLLAMADGDYPADGLPIAASDYAAIAAAQLAGAYLEMPDTLPGDPATYAPSIADYFHRLVAYTGDLAPWGVPPLTIMQAQGAYFQDYPLTHLPSCVMGYAEVAGVDTAVFGLPPAAQLNPVLFAASGPPSNASSPPCVSLRCGTTSSRT